MDGLTLFGAMALAVMLFCYALERRSAWFTFGFGWACLAAAGYGFLAGTWPFGVLETIWAAIAFHRWWRDHRSPPLSAAK